VDSTTPARREHTISPVTCGNLSFSGSPGFLLCAASERSGRRPHLTGGRKVLTNCHGVLTDRCQVAPGFPGRSPSGWGSPLRRRHRPTRWGRARHRRPRSGLALRHRVAIGASQGRPPPERLPSSRSGRRVQGSAWPPEAPASTGNWDDTGLAVVDHGGLAGGPSRLPLGPF
jgi:hypothetical protein